MRGTRRRRVATALLLGALCAGAVWGGSVVSADPVRAGVTGWWPWADDADRAEAVVVDELVTFLEQSAGPYSGPDIDLGDVVAVSPPVDPAEAHVSDRGWLSVVRAEHRSTGSFRAEGEMLVVMRFYRRDRLIGWRSGDVVERCRTVSVRYDRGMSVDTARAACPG